MSGMGSHQSHGKGENVWLTPPEIVKALGPFDLDPCFGSPRPWDTAAEHYGPTDNNGMGGMHGDWHGMVWCNPPYDREAWRWLSKLADHGDGIALIFARTEVEQFHRQVWERASSVFFLEGRLFFHRHDGRRAPHNAGAPSVLVTYGYRAKLRIGKAARHGLIKGKYIDLECME